MKVRTLLVPLLLFLLAVPVTGPDLLAGEGKKSSEEVRPGKKAKKVPPGWKKGMKKGWKDAQPPGWRKWNKKKQHKWKGRLERSKKGVAAKAKRKGLKKKELQLAVDGLESAARLGVPVLQAEACINACLDAGISGEDALMVGVTMSAGVEAGVDFDVLGTQISVQVEAGVSGEALASKIGELIGN